MDRSARFHVGGLQILFETYGRELVINSNAEEGQVDLMQIFLATKTLFGARQCSIVDAAAGARGHIYVRLWWR